MEIGVIKLPPVKDIDIATADAAPYLRVRLLNGGDIAIYSKNQLINTLFTGAVALDGHLEKHTIDVYKIIMLMHYATAELIRRHVPVNFRNAMIGEEAAILAERMEG